MINFKIDKIENSVVTYNVMDSKYIIELKHSKNILKFESKVNKYSPEVEFDFYHLFNINSMAYESNSEDINFIVRCLVYILDNRDKIIDGIEHYSDKVLKEEK